MADVGPVVSLDVIAKHVVAKAYSKLRNDLTLELAGQRHSADEKRRQLALYFATVRIQLTRLLALVRWLPNAAVIPCLVERRARAWQWGLACTQTADSLYTINGTLADARLPPYDVSLAVDLLTTGTFRRLPKLEYMWNDGQHVLNAAELQGVIAQLTDRMRARVLQEKLPPGVMVQRCSDGLLCLSVPQYFQATFTLTPADPPSLNPLRWQLITFRLLVRPAGADDRCLPTHHESRLRDVANTRLGTLEPQPLASALRMLQTAAATLALDILRHQIPELSPAAPSYRYAASKADKVALGEKQENEPLRLEFWAPSKAGKIPFSVTVSLDADHQLVVTDTPPLRPPDAATDTHAPRLVPTALSLRSLVLSSMRLQARALLEELKSILVADSDLYRIFWQPTEPHGNSTPKLQVYFGREDISSPAITITVDPRSGKYGVIPSFFWSDDSSGFVFQRADAVANKLRNVATNWDLTQFQQAALAHGTVSCLNLPYDTPCPLSPPLLFIPFPAFPDSYLAIKPARGSNSNLDCRAACYYIQRPVRGASAMLPLDLSDVIDEIIQSLSQQGSQSQAADEDSEPPAKRTKHGQHCPTSNLPYHALVLKELFACLEALAASMSFRCEHAAQLPQSTAPSMESITTTPAPSSAFFEYQQFPSSSSFRIPHSFEAEFQLLQIPNGGLKARFKINGGSNGVGFPCEVRVPFAAMPLVPELPLCLNTCHFEDACQRSAVAAVRITAEGTHLDGSIMFLYNGPVAKLYSHVSADITKVHRLWTLAAACYALCADLKDRGTHRPHFRFHWNSCASFSLMRESDGRGTSVTTLTFSPTDRGDLGVTITPRHTLHDDAIDMLTRALCSFQRTKGEDKASLKEALVSPSVLCGSHIAAVNALALDHNAVLVPRNHRSAVLRATSGKEVLIFFNESGLVALQCGHPRHSRLSFIISVFP